ncbi:CARDB domain-containing protein [Roseobacter sp. EG26]|uniref:CARDB domain-containing protein n=1 Tax=Roseobacter sp. EG26 TaxID=3412477 RepID=UPI003CE57DCD
MKKILTQTALAALTLTLIGTDVKADKDTTHVTRNIQLLLKNTQSIVPIRNKSDSGDIKDFELEVKEDVIRFSMVSGTVWCGYGDGEVPSNRIRAIGLPEETRLSLGLMHRRGGHSTSQTDFDGVYHAVRNPEFKVTINELENAYNFNSYKKAQIGWPTDFEVPLDKLKNPVGKSAASIDPVSIFDAALTKHVNEGGEKLDFLRSDHNFVVELPITLRTACIGVRGLSDTRSHAYVDKSVQIVFAYKGDKSLHYKPAVSTGGSGNIQNPLSIVKASIKVDPPKSTGICPRTVTASGIIELDHKPAKTRNVQYRFLEDGKPATPWKTVGVAGIDQFKVRHKIKVGKTKSGSLVKGVSKANNGGGIQLNQPQLIKNKPTVAIEAKIGKQKETAVTTYIANCNAQGTIAQDPKPSLNPGTQKPDLTARGQIQIGSVKAPWGGSINLKASDALSNDRRGCQFRFGYDVVNIGKAASGPFLNRLRRDGKVAHKKSLTGLAKASGKNIGGTILLDAGTYPLTLSVDDDKKVQELKENNNVHKVMVTAPSECGGRDGSRHRD